MSIISQLKKYLKFWWIKEWVIWWLFYHKYQPGERFPLSWSNAPFGSWMQHLDFGGGPFVSGFRSFSLSLNPAETHYWALGPCFLLRLYPLSCQFSLLFYIVYFLISFQFILSFFSFHFIFIFILFHLFFLFQSFSLTWAHFTPHIGICVLLFIYCMFLEIYVPF